MKRIFDALPWDLALNSPRPLSNARYVFWYCSAAAYGVPAGNNAKSAGNNNRKKKISGGPLGTGVKVEMMGVMVTIVAVTEVVTVAGWATAMTVVDVLGGATVVYFLMTPAHEHALAYRTVPEHALAVVGTATEHIVMAVVLTSSRGLFWFFGRIIPPYSVVSRFPAGMSVTVLLTVETSTTVS
jgi:hypothetical protein